MREELTKSFPRRRSQSEQQGGFMHSEPARLCAKCRVQIAPYDVLTIYNKMPYHQPCFLTLVREEADQEKARRAEVGLAHGAEAKSA
jgi:hypothetical protein